MKRFLKIFCLLLCLVLAARGGAAAVLPITDARWHNEPVSEGGAVVEQAPIAGSHDGNATQVSADRAAPEGSSHGVVTPQHHHSCHQLCTMLVAAAPAPMLAPASCHASAPVQARQDFSSAIASPPDPPPRELSNTDQAVCS